MGATGECSPYVLLARLSCPDLYCYTFSVLQEGMLIIISVSK
jgi:hypothetical protein